MLVLIIGASLMGSAAAVRELVKEREIYRRERAIGLSLGAYLASKIVCLGGIVGIETVLFAVLAVLGDHPPDSAILFADPALEVIVAVLAAALAALAVGLTISALITNADRGMPLLVLLVMAQLVLCGGLFSVHGRAGLEQLSWIVPARWAFAMAAATINLNTPAATRCGITRRPPGFMTDFCWPSSSLPSSRSRPCYLNARPPRQWTLKIYTEHPRIERLRAGTDWRNVNGIL